MTSNNPPDVELALTKAQAQFLLRNCDSNIIFGLNAIQGGNLSETSVRKLVEQMEQFKEIRALLLKQGVESE